MYKKYFRSGVIITLLMGIVGYVGLVSAEDADVGMTSKQHSIKNSTRLSAIAGRPYHHLLVAQTKKAHKDDSNVRRIVRYTGSSLRPYHHLLKVSRIEQTEMAVMEVSDRSNNRRFNYRDKYKHFSH